jgi:hypothetical protein
MNYDKELDAALQSQDSIPRNKFLAWIEAATDPANLSKLCEIIKDGYHRIQPELGGEVACNLTLRYFLECIRQNVQESDDVLSRWEAAQDLHAWFCQLHESGDASQFLQSAAQSITDLFLAGDQGVRDAIEMGFLEHVLETEGLRHYFEHWASDTRLRDAWSNALEWGKAHPDFMLGMLKKLWKLQE